MSPLLSFGRVLKTNFSSIACIKTFDSQKKQATIFFSHGNIEYLENLEKKICLA
jgi:hypothetical protein